MSSPNKQWPDRPMWRCTNCDFTCSYEGAAFYHRQHQTHELVWSMPPTSA